MPGFIDTVIESLKQSASLPLWLYFLAVMLLEAVVMGLVTLFFLLVGLTLLLAFFGISGFQNPAGLLSEPGTFLGIAALAGSLVAILLVVLTFVSSYFTGLRFNLFNNFMKNKKLDFGKSFEMTTPRAFTFFKATLLVGILILIAILILALPVIFSIPALVAVSSPGPVIGLVLYAVIAFLALGIVLFMLSPILNLIAPAAFFEKQGAIDTIRKAVYLARTNYLGNLAFVLVFAVITVGIGWVIGIIMQVISLFTLFPAIAISEAGGPNTALAMAGFAAYGIIYVILFVPYTVWSTVFETAAFRNLYFLDLDLLGKPKAKPRKRAGKK